MHKPALILLILLLTGSCYQENRVDIEAPDPLLTEDQMVNILTDIQLAEAIISYNKLHRENTEQEYSDSLFKTIFDHYEVTADEFKDNLDYYNNFPDQMEDIHEQMLTKLSQRQVEVEEKVRQDSIQDQNDTIQQQ